MQILTTERLHLLKEAALEAKRLEGQGWFRIDADEALILLANVQAAAEYRQERDAIAAQLTAVAVHELRAELERLKAELRHVETARDQWKDRAEIAESRLAAIRKRASNLNELIDRFLWTSGEKETSGNALQFVARVSARIEALEDGGGDAP